MLLKESNAFCLFFLIRGTDWDDLDALKGGTVMRPTGKPKRRFMDVEKEDKGVWCERGGCREEGYMKAGGEP